LIFITICLFGSIRGDGNTQWVGTYHSDPSTNGCDESVCCCTTGTVIFRPHPLMPHTSLNIDSSTTVKACPLHVSKIPWPINTITVWPTGNTFHRKLPLYESTMTLAPDASFIHNVWVQGSQNCQEKIIRVSNSVPPNSNNPAKIIGRHEPEGELDSPEQIQQSHHDNTHKPSRSNVDVNVQVEY